MPPSKLLPISVAANLILVAAVAASLFHRPAAPSPQPGKQSTPAQTPLKTQAPEALAAGKRWTWSDIESEDYHVYIRNLRNVQCPEETIRDIITADVTSLYRGRRQELASAGKLSSMADEALRREEATLLRTLLGAGAAPEMNIAQQPHPAGAPAYGTANTAGSSNGGRAARETRVAPPAILADPSPQQGFTDSQMARIAQLRDEFAAAVGGPGQDPADPEYLHRWAEAQPRFDQQFKTLFGARAFQEQQQAAASLMTSAGQTQAGGTPNGGTAAAPGSASSPASSPGSNAAPQGLTGSIPRFDHQIKMPSGAYTFY
jgi:hypothetical protein